MYTILELLVSLGMLAISIIPKQKDFVLLFASAIINIVVWADWFSIMPGIAIVFWFIAVYQCCLAIVNIYLSGGQSKGWSQFKAMIHRGQREEE